MSALAADYVEGFARWALGEDMGRGDVTTAAVLEPRAGVAELLFREGGVVCGLSVVEAVFRHLDPNLRFSPVLSEGTCVQGPAVVAHIEGSVAALLGGERVALNIIARMAATATLTRRFVDAIAGTHAQILDTRKTTPGMRQLQKYAVRVGGGRNHRFGLDDGILIKDNHIALAGGLAPALARARRLASPILRIEVEVESLTDVREALRGGAQMILLDNMPVETMREAVRIVAGAVPLEASGGITFDTVRSVAETGVDFISVGALTHSASAVDVSLEVRA
jgi:nicotinate-nucleotide pyrophosphorylase (carboxylating)